MPQGKQRKPAGKQIRSISETALDISFIEYVGTEDLKQHLHGYSCITGLEPYVLRSGAEYIMRDEASIVKIYYYT
jgi:hypothetical protein